MLYYDVQRECALYVRIGSVENQKDFIHKAHAVVQEMVCTAFIISGLIPTTPNTTIKTEKDLGFQQNIEFRTFTDCVLAIMSNVRS